MAQQDNPYEDQDIWNDLSEAGSEMKNVFNEMTNNYFTENSFLSAVGNLMKVGYMATKPSASLLCSLFLQ